MNKFLQLLMFFLIPCLVNAEIMAGAAKVKITPPDLDESPVLAGYRLLNYRHPMFVNKDLYARALVIEQNGEQFCFVAVDLLGMAYDDIQIVKEEFPNLIVAYSHTHSAPDVIGFWSGIFNSYKINGYKNFVVNGIFSALREAAQNVEPCTISFSSGSTSGLNNDNRVPFLIDKSLEVMSVHSSNNDVISILVNWSAHPLNFNKNSRAVSSDYPGYLTSMLDEKYGGVSLFFNGAIGGHISTSNAHLSKPDGVEHLMLDIRDPVTGDPAPMDGAVRAEIVAKNLVVAVSEVLKDKTVFDDNIRFKSTDFDLDFDNKYFVVLKLFGNIFLARKIEYRSDFDDAIMTLLMLGIGTLTIILALVLIDLITNKNNVSVKRGLAILGLILVNCLLIYIYVMFSFNAFTVRSNVSYAEFGSIAAFITVPGEIYPELSIGTSHEPDSGCDYDVEFETPIKSLLSCKHKFVVGLGNDEIGYIIPKCLWDQQEPFAYHRRGMQSPQYNEKMSLGPETAGVVVSKVRELVGR